MKLNKKQTTALEVLKKYTRLVKQGRMVYMSFYLWDRLGGQEEVTHITSENKRV